MNKKLLYEYKELVNILDNESIKKIYENFLKEIGYDIQKIDPKNEKRYIAGILAHVPLSKESYEKFETIYNLLDKLEE